MTDFPNPSSDGMLLPTHISSWSDLMGGRSWLGAAGGVQAWPTANLAIFIPLWIPWPYFAARAFWANGSSAGGNTDVGIYTPSGVRLWSAGSTAESGASAVQYVTAGIMLTPGVYYMAYTHSATSGSQVFGGSVSVQGRLGGLYSMATALPLPANATFAAWTSTILPLVGITRTASSF